MLNDKFIHVIILSNKFITILFNSVNHIINYIIFVSKKTKPRFKK